MNERPTFSPFWHRVRAMKPRLRAHVEISRQHYRGRRWHVVHDPTSNQFYRLNPVAYDFVCSLDGHRTVDEAWQMSLSKFGDAAPTQNEIIQLISQLYNSNLFSADSTPETEQLLRRGRERIKKKAAAQAIGIMYLKIRLFNPDRIVSAIEPVLRPALNLYGFVAWVVLVVWALVSLVPHWERLTAGFDSIMSPSNLWLLPVVFAVTKAWHELGHGVLCKRFGGQVPEFGFMLLILLPSPYVDASSAWAFGNKWKRIAVGAGGMIFELFLAALAAFVWIWAQDTGRSGELVSQIAYNVMVTAGVATVLFNANPLMRFDGYYMLADLLETPNLYQRSNKQLMHYIQRFIYRLENLTPPTTQAGERAVLTIYGVLAGAYRIFLFITITLFVMGQFFGLGLVLAIWSAAAWFLIPLGKLMHWLATSPMLSEKRARTVWLTAGMAAVLLVVLGVIPMPDRRFGAGVIESAQRTGVYAQVDGFVLQAHVRPGQSVRAGEPIVTMESVDLVERRRSMTAQLDQMLVEERRGLQQNDSALSAIAAERARVLRDSIEELDRRIEQLTVRAPHDGVIVTGNPNHLVGAFLRRGQPVCEVVQPSDLRVAVTMDQRQGGWLFESAGVAAPAGDADTPPVLPSGPIPAGPDSGFVADFRLYSDVDRVLTASRVEVVPAGMRQLASPALGFAGGGTIETMQDDQTGRVAKRPQFSLRLHAADPAQLASLTLPGERVLVRFQRPARPLLAQWMERLSKEIQGRVKI